MHRVQLLSDDRRTALRTLAHELRVASAGLQVAAALGDRGLLEDFARDAARSSLSYGLPSGGI